MRAEVWKEIEGVVNKYGHTYSVSSLGDVRNNSTKRILSKRPDKKGYLRVSLSGVEYRVHRLVALYFVDNPDPSKYDMVNHLDTDKSNNIPSNLEWCDHDYNMAHAVSNGVYKDKSKGVSNPRAILSEEDVLNIWVKELSTEEIVSYYGVSEGYSKILRRKGTWKHLIPVYNELIGKGNSYKKAIVEPIRTEDFYFDKEAE